ncbi:hypothetical protein ACN27E_10520 [Mycobacterium sp. WMMD1722]|uniref:hypothetical protein n=1 Tax=Mycobacterium sp. WMMD1722 TaxID=3404117 RepID=UPI003BF608EF
MSIPGREPLHAARHIARATSGLVGIAATVSLAALAGAQPPPAPPGPPLPPPPPGPQVPVIGAPLGTGGLGVLAQSGLAPAGPLGVPALPGIDRDTVLGQNVAPAAPGAGPGTPPNLRVFNNAYGVPLNEAPAAPGAGTVFDVAPGHEADDVTGREWLGRYIDLYRDGQLKGSLLGQTPQSQLGLPLPGTAPPPGTNLPPGLIQYSPVSPPPPGG